MKLNEFVDYFYETADFKRMAVSTQKDYRFALTKLSKFLVEDELIKDINRVDIQRFLDSLKVGFVTNNKQLTYLRAFFNRAVNLEIIAKSPVLSSMNRKPDRSKGEIDPAKVPRSFTAGQLALLLERFQNHSDKKHYLITRLLIESGCRISEALNIKRTEIFPNYSYLPITKSGNPRFIYFTESFGKELKEYIQSHKSPFVFPAQTSIEQPLSYDSYQGVFDTLRMGIVNKFTGKLITIHAIRHSFATMRVGVVDALELKELMGHESLNTTLRYITASHEQTQKAYQKTEFLLAQ